MKTMFRGALAGLIVLGTGLLSTVAGDASAFFGWRVVGVPQWDTLNVRAYPSSQSRILVAYPNGTKLSLTGKCTGGVDLDYINGWPAWRQAQAVRHEWCEAWVKPPGAPFRTGWVYGRYIRPL